MPKGLPPTRASARIRGIAALGPDAERDLDDLLEGNTVPCLLAVTEKRPSGSEATADDPQPSSFSVRYTTPVPEDPPPKPPAPGSPFMPTAATDALAKSDSSSPLKSVSWSSQTVEQFDDRCVQISIDALKELIGGKGVDSKDKRRLRNFQSVHIENLPDNAESSKYRPLVSRAHA